MERAGLPGRLVWATEYSKLMLRDVRFEPGSLARLKKLNGPVILAVTHLSNWDIAVFVNALGKETDIRAKIVQASSHNNWKDKPVEMIGAWLAGSGNFLTVSYGSGKNKDVGSFRRGDYGPMVEAMEEAGYSIIMAASYDSRYVGFNQKGVTLPPKGGGAAVYLARITGRPIIPVAVVMESRWGGRAVIKIGEEILIGKKDRLRAGSDKVMRALASMLPAEKRGSWGKDI